MKVRALDVVPGIAPVTTLVTEQPSSAQIEASHGAVSEVHVGTQAARIQAAQAQMAALPEMDMQRIAEIKAALERGEIGFDPQKIAGLIMRHHGGR